MLTESELEEYGAELRAQVCSRCIVRRAGTPPCGPRGFACGVEEHLEQVVEICRNVGSPLIDPYLEELKARVCATCPYQAAPICPCPLKYLLPLAVSAVETVEERRRAAVVGAGI